MKPMNREVFYDEFNKIIDFFYGNDKVRKKVEAELEERNILVAETIRIFNKNLVVQTLDPAIIYLILKNLYNITSNSHEYNIDLNKISREKINPEKYFTELEISRYESYKRELKKQQKYPLEIPNVLKLDEELYSTIMTIDKIAQLHFDNFIAYNEDTQRGTRIVKYKNSITKQLDLNTKSIDAMYDRIKKHKQIPDDIWLNLLQNGEDSFDYDETNKILTIYSGEIDSIDGFHRELSILDVIKDEEVLKNDPELRNMNWGVKIANFDVDKANEFIEQQDNRNPLRKSKKESLNKDKLSNLIVDKLNSDSYSELKNRIAIQEGSLEYGNALVSFITLSNAIDYHFRERLNLLNNKKDVFDISKWLVKCFTQLIGSYPDEFNYAYKKQYSFINSDRAFIGYVAIFSELYNKPNWDDKMYEVMNKIDFSIDNKDWENIGFKNYKFNKGTIKKISDYFISKLN
jgi:hypothetical protein